jgi:hypothetical protein
VFFLGISIRISVFGLPGPIQLKATAFLWSCKLHSFPGSRLRHRKTGQAPPRRFRTGNACPFSAFRTLQPCKLASDQFSILFGGPNAATGLPGFTRARARPKSQLVGPEPMATEPGHLDRLLASLILCAAVPLSSWNRTTARRSVSKLVTMNPTQGNSSTK